MVHGEEETGQIDRRWTQLCPNVISQIVRGCIGRQRC
jgi:hypothetical protein